MRSRILCAFFLLLGLSTPASAASFDCKQARSPREIAVCRNPKLSAEDTKLATAYNRLLARLTPTAAGDVRNDQRAWLRYLDRACPPNGKGDRVDIGACLAEEYSNRLGDFEHPETLANGHLLYARGVFVVLPNTLTDAETLGRNPGFGVSRFAFPQINNPNKAESTFNTTVSKQAMQMTADDRNRHPQTFNADPDGQIDMDWSLLGQNSRLIVVDIQSMVMQYGAAHPSTTRRVLSFWLDRGRELQPGDVFAESSNWRSALVTPVATKLRADKDLTLYLRKDPELGKGITTGLADTHDWTIGRFCYTLTFDQYGVAAYAAGMPSARFTWNELRPYLNPTLHPETLPALHSRDD